MTAVGILVVNVIAAAAAAAVVVVVGVTTINASSALPGSCYGLLLNNSKR
jgi:hypothetical protein